MRSVYRVASIPIPTPIPISKGRCLAEPTYEDARQQWAAGSCGMGWDSVTIAGLDSRGAVRRPRQSSIALRPSAIFFQLKLQLFSRDAGRRRFGQARPAWRDDIQCRAKAR
jgi:hypothetical protein